MSWRMDRVASLTRRGFGAGLLGVALAGPAPAQATGTDLLLVLLNDGSGSIDSDEYALQREGTAAAVERPEVLQAVARLPTRSIALAYGEWGSPGTAQLIVPWVRIAGSQDAADFADRSEELRGLVVAKNKLFFHRWRPANETYIFLFRKHEQGNNAVEIPQFDPLVEEAERKVRALARRPAER